jgi:protein-glucosylgalactosylhydroxylysine glucosidase
LTTTRHLPDTLRAIPALLLGVAVACGTPQANAAPPTGPAVGAVIDRQALVSRHNPVVRRFDPENPLTVGNGELAFTADVTGLQTFAEAFQDTIPLGTLSQWGWHTAPNPQGWSIDRFQHKEFESFGRMVGYADIPNNQRTPEIEWLRANPHRLHLGRIAFRLTMANGQPARPEDLTDIEQTLDLWTGMLVSRFRLNDQPVVVETVCHPTRDLVAVRVASGLLAQGGIGIQIAFPYGTGDTRTADWDHPEAHQTDLADQHGGGVTFRRRLDADQYEARAAWKGTAALSRQAPHRYILEPGATTTELELVVSFAPRPLEQALPDFAATRGAAHDHWQSFWRSGGAIDLSESSDPRWRELERRIVLSQYLTAVQCNGSLPPQETGLTYNTWEGKFHLEMHWWHAAHFALWNRIELLERSLDYYRHILPRAEGTARRQGYRGARWPKMTDPAGAESPSAVGPFLVWQQPHPIYYAELGYRAHGDRATLERYRDVVFATADFMASYATWDEGSQRYVLGPVLQCAQEIFPKQRTFNPTYELTYWRWGLETAQAWRARLGLPRDPQWDKVLQGLARPPVAAGKYLFAESAPESYKDPRWAQDHPSVTAALGMLPGPGIERETMRRTLAWITDSWNWPDTWGWDYPMLAMCAARLGETQKTIDFLLLDTPKNFYRLNGHNHQRPGLTIYLPGNGGLLAAVAMMAEGWDGAPERPAPGFPADGRWKVRYEGLRRMP